MSGIYSALDEGVRRWIDERGWSEWNPIQAAAIPGILAGRGALLLAPTASGKTEAAVLPLISRILASQARPVALLYVAPLRALINDQTRRSYRLLESNGLGVAWWHGDLSVSKRRSILKDPPHALFTTAESIDVMLSSPTYGYGALLGNVRYVLVDEIHAFAESDRGAQLMSVLARLESRMREPLQRVGLSATAGTPAAIGQWMKSGREDAPPIDVVCDTSTKARRIGVGLIPEVRDEEATRAENDTASLRKLATIVERHVAGKRAIVFTNSRNEAERLTIELNERRITAMIHHGSVDREIRRATEDAFRAEGPCTIVATSTLELGIDIGDLEMVVQIGSPAKASSLLQRIGRSGRRTDAESVGIVYAKTVDGLPQALATCDLALRGEVESLHPDTAALHVLFQQVIQLVRERDQARPRNLQDVLLGAGAFRDVTQQEFDELIGEMLGAGFLEARPAGAVGIGSETERKLGYANYRDLYATFEADEGWDVRHGAQSIGMLDRAYPIPENRDVTFVLAGRRWHVIHADRERRLLQVEVATSGAIPNWHSEGPGGSFEVMRHTLALLESSATSDLEKPGLAPYMAKARGRAARLGLSSDTMSVAAGKRGTEIWTYGGDVLNGYLALLLMAAIDSDRAVSAGSAMILAHEAPEAVAESLTALLSDAARRRELERAALEIAPPAGIGKFWRFLGPQTRRNVLKRHVAAGGSYLQLLPPQSVRLITDVNESEN